MWLNIALIFDIESVIHHTGGISDITFNQQGVGAARCQADRANAAKIIVLEDQLTVGVQQAPDNIAAVFPQRLERYLVACGGRKLEGIGFSGGGQLPTDLLTRRNGGCLRQIQQPEAVIARMRALRTDGKRILPCHQIQRRDTGISVGVGKVIAIDDRAAGADQTPQHL